MTEANLTLARLKATVVTRDAAAVLVTRDRGRWLGWLIPECPFCGLRHLHGARGYSGEEGPRDFLGMRAAHCIFPPLAEIRAYCLFDLVPERTDRIFEAFRRKHNAK